MPSYMGLIDLAYRSGKIKKIYAKEVRENDIYEVTEGTNESIIHKRPKGGRGKVIEYYAVAIFKDGSITFETMDLDMIDKIKALAPSSPAWKKWPGEMSKKSVLKRLCKRIPMSMELSQAVDYDHKVATGEPQAVDGVIDVDFKAEDYKDGQTGVDKAKSMDN